MNKRIYFNDKFIELIDKNEFEMLALQTNTIKERTNSEKTLNFLIEDFLDAGNLHSEKLSELQLNDVIDYFKT
ncbi:MAG: hypothetical protein WCR21_06090, partial [Bacteroidota bacterium]